MIQTFMTLFYVASVFAAPTFSKSMIRIGGKTISVEIADTDERREHGLMYRTQMPAEEGMLFVFDNEEPLSFWMMNTRIKLQIGYFNKDRALVKKLEMVPAPPLVLYPETYPSGKPAMYALEMNTGWFDKNKIELGDRFEFVDAKTTQGPKANPAVDTNTTPAKSGSKTRAHKKP